MSKLALIIAAAVLVLAGCGGDGGESAAGGQAAFDRAFIDAMVPHHESAIEMARDAKQAGLTQPELVEIADDIIATQQQEIDQMLAWREEWFGSREREHAEQAVEALGLTMEEAGMTHAGDLSTTDAVDQAFAGMMIGHHTGAIRMAELAEERAEHDEIKELAEDIIAAQQREIETLGKHAGEAHG
jgi:uncharacterized protein (DUF305 family)